ncbi:M23 family metallopeptidase [Streptomyces sp. NPDC101393]|uniref:M23 family metallopeptidase n=1 Tax=Streptomyces sp. NPDC101393 TaxID=3366141 RepID=UPI003825A9CB
MSSTSSAASAPLVSAGPAPSPSSSPASGNPATGPEAGDAHGRDATAESAEAREHVSAAIPAGDDRAWPVKGVAGLRPTVLHGWEPPPSPWAAGHRGVDLAAAIGSPVRAAAAGRVAFAGKVAGRGVLTIELSRSGRPPLRTTYEPVRPTARKGERVRAGQPVAVLQHGPFHCRAPCLHWGLRRGKSYLDPISLMPPEMLRGGPSRLLPVIGIPVPGAPHSTAAASTEAALLGAIALAATTLWALGRLTPITPKRSAKRAGDLGIRRRARLQGSALGRSVGKNHEHRP